MEINVVIPEQKGGKTFLVLMKFLRLSLNLFR